MRKFISPIGLLASLALLQGTASAVTLVDPTSQPIGGQFQSWADAAQMPTLSGTLILDVTTDGPCPIACSEGPGQEWILPDGSTTVDTAAAYGPAETWVIPTVDQYSLYWELGHQFDWLYLDDATRANLATLWGSSAQWWDTEAGLLQGYEDGLEATFASVYSLCSLGDTDSTSLPWPNQPALTAEQVQNTCALITAIGRQARATMPPPPQPQVPAAVVTPDPAPPTASPLTMTTRPRPKGIVHKKKVVQHRPRRGRRRLRTGTSSGRW